MLLAVLDKRNGPPPAGLVPLVLFLVFLALGFLGPEAEVLKGLGVKQDARSNIQTPANVCLSLLLLHV